MHSSCWERRAWETEDGGGGEACNPGHALLPLQTKMEKNLQVEESSSS